MTVSPRLADWGLFATPDDFDHRSHDAIATEYVEERDRTGWRQHMDGKTDTEILADYAEWLDNYRGNDSLLRHCGPGENGLEETAERFLKERANRKVNHRG